MKLRCWFHHPAQSMEWYYTKLIQYSVAHILCHFAKPDVPLNLLALILHLDESAQETKMGGGH